MSRVNFDLPQNSDTIADFYVKTKGGSSGYKGTDGKRHYLHIHKSNEQKPVWLLGSTTNRRMAARISDIDKVMQRLLLRENPINSDNLSGISKILTGKIQKEKAKLRGFLGFFRKIFQGRQIFQKVENLSALKINIEKRLLSKQFQDNITELEKLNAAQKSEITYLNSAKVSKGQRIDSMKLYKEISDRSSNQKKKELDQCLAEKERKLQDTQENLKEMQKNLEEIRKEIETIEQTKIEGYGNHIIGKKTSKKLIQDEKKLKIDLTKLRKRKRNIESKTKNELTERNLNFINIEIDKREKLLQAIEKIKPLVKEKDKKAKECQLLEEYIKNLNETDIHALNKEIVAMKTDSSLLVA